MKILLFTNTMTSLTPQAIQPICTWLTDKGIEYDIVSSEIVEEQNPLLEGLSASIADFDLLCSFGGDGTTLRAAHIIGTSGVPLLSYNFGRLGFLSGACKDDLIPAMQAAIDGKLNYDARSLLVLTVAYKDGRFDHQIAVNELAVTRGHFGRIVELELFINDSLVTTVRGDGILVATPTGSTGYALSAGGPIISPMNESMCVVPISPHSLTSRAVVTSRDDVMRIVPSSQNRQKIALFIDGEVFWIADKSLENAAEPDASNNEIVWIEIRVSDKKLRLARFGHYDFYEHISQTFFRGRNA